MNSSGADDPRIKAISVALLLGTLLIYAPVNFFEFISFDDGLFITSNPMVLGGLTWEGLAWAFGTSGVDYWRPLSWLSHMLDVELFGLEAGAHHAVSLLWHTANALLLFHVLRRMTGNLWPSALVAALFAWHPLHVESVAWVAERKDVMCAFFWFLTMGAYARYTEAPSWRRYGLVVFCFVLGLMSKPMIVTLPCVLLLLDVWPLRRWELPAWRMLGGGVPDTPVAAPATPRTGLGRLVLEKLPLLLLGAVISQATYVAAGQIGAVRSLASIPLAARINNSLGAYAAYLGKMLWPVDMAVIYQFDVWGRWPLLLAALMLATLSVLAVWQARARPFLLVGWLWFLGTLVPVIGLVQAGGQSFADRYTYVPLIGVFIMLAWGLANLASHSKHHAAGLKWLALLVLTGCLWVTARQLNHWRDSLTLFRHTLAVTGPQAMPLALYANALAAAGHTRAAIPILQEALRLSPNYADAQLALTRCYLMVGEHAQARAWVTPALRSCKLPSQTAAIINIFIRLVEGQPDHPEAHYDLAVAWAAAGQTTNALHHLGEALRLKPDYAEVWIDRGVLLAGERRHTEAVRHYREAIRLSPTNDLARANLGGLLLDTGHPGEAVAHLSEAIRLQPGNAAARHNLALALAQLGRDDEAAAEFRAVLQLQPNNVNSMNKLAWLLATSPVATVRNGTDALRLAQRVRELAAGQAAAHDTLAAALAAGGRYAEAAQAAARARELAMKLGQPALAEAIGDRLRLYQAGQPFISPSGAR